MPRISSHSTPLADSQTRPESPARAEQPASRPTPEEGRFATLERAPQGTQADAQQRTGIGKLQHFFDGAGTSRSQSAGASSSAGDTAGRLPAPTPQAAERALDSVPVLFARTSLGEPQQPRRASRRVPPAEIVQNALRTLADFAGEAAQAFVPTDWPQLRVLADEAFREVRNAQQAMLQPDPQSRRTLPRGNIRAALEQYKTLASYHGLVAARMDVLQLRMQFSDEALELENDEMVLAARAESLAESVAHGEAVLAQISPYWETAKAVLASHARPGTSVDAQSREMAAIGIACAHKISWQIHRDRVSLSFLRLHQRSSGASALPESAAMIRRFSRRHDNELDDITDLHQDPRVAVAPGESEWLQGYTDALAGYAEAFCLWAGQQPETQRAHLEPAVFEVVGALRALLHCLDDVRHQIKLPPGLPTPISEQTLGGRPVARPELIEAPEPAVSEEERQRAVADSWAVPAHLLPGQSSQSSQSSQAGGARRSGKGRSKPASRVGKGARAAQPQGSASTAQPGVSQHVLDTRQRLRSFPEPRLLTSLQPEAMIALGESLRRDTGALRVAIADGTDPLTVSSLMRSALLSWFGNPVIWHKLHARLQMEPSATDAGQGDDSPRAQVEQRIAGIEALSQQVDIVEQDLIKRYPFPKASHVGKLLEADQVAAVSALRLLRSPTDPSAQLGTTFEAAIHLRPTSSGEEAQPLYLHLHTEEPVDVRACGSLGLDKLAAAHVKTAPQRALGATWERLQQELGAEQVHVHRGAMTADVLGKLQKRMTEEPARTAEPASGGRRRRSDVRRHAA